MARKSEAVYIKQTFNYLILQEKGQLFHFPTIYLTLTMVI